MPSSPSPRPILVGLPYDGSSSFLEGARLAPAAIRQALHSPAGNRWSEALIDLGAPGALEEAGDLDLAQDASARTAIEAAIQRLAAAGSAPIALGGDHSVSYPILAGLRPAWPKLHVVHLDAHPDLYDEFEGDRYSHACPFARILESGLADSLVQVGLRAATGHQAEQAKRFGVEQIDMRAWAAGRRPALRGPVYLSVDLDGFDPAFAPGVSHPEPGGLGVREVLTLIQHLPGPIAGADIVELNPKRDLNDMTARLGAKLVKEIASRMLQLASPDLGPG
jgi:agmatinase